MTLAEIEVLPREMLTPKDIAGYLGCHPYWINLQVKENPNFFPFPVIRIGNRVKIPKTAFLKIMKGETIC
jgi:hypothetical protein